MQVMGTTCLGARAGKSFTTKGLGSHNRTNLVTVNVHIANPNPLANLPNRAFNAGMETKRKAKTRGIQ